MFVTNWISTTKIQKISEITNFFRHYFLSRTEVFTLKEEDFNELLPSLLTGYVAHFLKWINRILPPSYTKIWLLLLCVGTVEWTGQGTFGLLRNSEIGNALLVIYKVSLKVISFL